MKGRERFEITALVPHKLVLRWPWGRQPRAGAGAAHRMQDCPVSAAEQLEPGPVGLQGLGSNGFYFILFLLAFCLRTMLI